MLRKIGVNMSDSEFEKIQQRILKVANSSTLEKLILNKKVNGSIADILKSLDEEQLRTALNDISSKLPDTVIESGYFNLVGDASDVLRSKEIIFSVYVDDFDQQVTEITNGGTYYISDEEFLNEIFDVANDGTNDLRIREGVGFDYGTNGITMRKYKQENLWASTEGTVVLIRLSEMYYILAECADSSEEAAACLNEVRTNRGVDMIVCTEDNRLDEIEKEYRKEFYGEGQLFYFYKRHGYSTFLHCPTNNMTESNYMFSWPDNETLFGITD